MRVVGTKRAACAAASPPPASHSPWKGHGTTAVSAATVEARTFDIQLYDKYGNAARDVADPGAFVSVNVATEAPAASATPARLAAAGAATANYRNGIVSFEYGQTDAALYGVAVSVRGSAVLAQSVTVVALEDWSPTTSTFVLQQPNAIGPGHPGAVKRP